MISRGTKQGALLTLREQGFSPQLVFDVGAQSGTFELYESFPEATHLLIEPIQEYEQDLKKICEGLQNATYVIAVAASQSGTTGLSVTNALKHSGMVPIDTNLNNSNTNSYREVQAVAIDDVCKKSNLDGPFLLKIDVDGREVEVLKGAINTLLRTEYVIIEVTFLGQIYDVMDFMRAHGFVAFDIVEPLYRPSDKLLWQVDMAFVKKDSRLRAQKSWE